MGQWRPTVQSLVAGTLGGACGGAMVGLIEAGVIAATSGTPEEYWLFPYAVLSYGLLGATCALAVVAVATAIRKTPQDTLGLGAAVAVFLLGGAVARYHVILRVFHEEIVLRSGVGIAVHAALLAFVVASALLVMYSTRPLQHYRCRLSLVTAGFVFCVAISSGAAVLASPHTVEPALVRAAGNAAKGHPNIILIVADTLRADAIGAYGAPADSTPALDRLARDAVRFAYAYAQATWTRPSIATILTSLYPSMHGAVHKLDVLPERVTTLAEALRSQGYWTAGFVSNINVAPVFNFQQGFDEYTYLAPDFYFWATDSATRLAIYKGLRVVRERLFGDRIYFYHYYQDAAVVDAAVSKWLDQHPPTPFFLFIHYMEPHDPYFEIPYNGHGVARVTHPDPPVAWKDYMRKLYGENVTYLDLYLGELFDRLKSLDLYDDTLIAVTADHGEEFREHGGWWHGTTLYEEQMHVPLIVKRPHEPLPGTVDSPVACSVDIAPTVMATAKLSVPAEFVGRDLFGVPPVEAEPLFAEEDLEGNVLAAVRVGPWKLITANPDNPRGLRPLELYDLSRDPTEHDNLAAAQGAKTEEMLQVLATERARIAPRSRVSSAPHAPDHRS